MMSAPPPAVRPAWQRLLPNGLTLARIVAVVPLALLLALGGEDGRWVVFFAFFFVAWSDGLDGYLARRWAVQSDWGRILDPVADKVLVCGLGTVLVATGPLTGWALVGFLVILVRELVIGGLREGLAAQARTLPVSALSKVKTLLQLHAIWFATPFAVWPSDHVGWLLGALWGVTVAVTLWSAVDYVLSMLRPAPGPEGSG